jgi:hypothetical protein
MVTTKELKLIADSSWLVLNSEEQIVNNKSAEVRKSGRLGDSTLTLREDRKTGSTPSKKARIKYRAGDHCVY